MSPLLSATERDAYCRLLRPVRKPLVIYTRIDISSPMNIVVC